MVIFLDKQRPPKKKMGRKQRTGSKSNPATGVQWANWLDNPAGAPGGGGGGGPAPSTAVITAITPPSMAVGADFVPLVVTGTGFRTVIEDEIFSFPPELFIDGQPYGSVVV